jgi:hypothetical protein
MSLISLPCTAGLVTFCGGSCEAGNRRLQWTSLIQGSDLTAAPVLGSTRKLLRHILKTLLFAPESGKASRDSLYSAAAGNDVVAAELSVTAAVWK